MKVIKTIKLHECMISSEAHTIMNALNNSEKKSMFVGGCVRGALLGEEVSDVDIATCLKPQDVIEKLTSIDIKVIPTGIEHGTVTAVMKDKVFEITTLRKDINTDGRRAVVSFTDDWLEDAKRRDFTMNALFADMEGNIYDPTGQGIDDLEARKVVFVGDPAQRISEDYLRILRFFRFYALYGEGEPDSAALKACADASDKIITLSKERITQEFFKIMSVDNPVPILDLMFKNNILDLFDFDEYDSKFLEYVCNFQLRFNLGFLAARLFVLAGLKPENIKTMKNFLLFPKVFLKDIEAISQSLKMDNLSKEHSVKVSIYKYGRVATAQTLMIELANDRVMSRYASKALDIIQNWKVPDFPINGNDLIQEGFKPGITLGKELKKREDAWIKRGFKN